MAERKHLINLHTSGTSAPSATNLELGEIAVAHKNADEAALYVKTNDGKVDAKFITENAVKSLISNDTRPTKTQVDLNTEAIKKLNSGSDVSGSVDNKVTALETKLKGDAAADYDTLGKVEDKIIAEADRAGKKEQALANSINTLNAGTETPGSVDSKVKVETDNRIKAIEALDFSLAGTDGTYIKGIEQVDGKITEVHTATIPKATVTGVKADEKVISLEGTELKTTLTLSLDSKPVEQTPEVSVPEEEVGKKFLRINGIDGATVAKLDASLLLKDGMLESGRYDADTKELVLVLNTDGEKTEVRVPVAGLVDTYTAGQGIDLQDHQFSVSVEDTDGYLTQTATGVKLAGVKQAIAGAKKEANDHADGLNTAMDARVAANEAKLADVSGDTATVGALIDKKIKGLSLGTTYAKKEVENYFGEGISADNTVVSAIATAKSGAVSEAKAETKKQITALNLKSASTHAHEEYATAAQGAKADTAIQEVTTDNTGYLDIADNVDAQHKKVTANVSNDILTDGERSGKLADAKAVKDFAREEDHKVVQYVNEFNIWRKSGDGNPKKVIDQMITVLPGLFNPDETVGQPYKRGKIYVNILKNKNAKVPTPLATNKLVHLQDKGQTVQEGLYPGELYEENGEHNLEYEDVPTSSQALIGNYTYPSRDGRPNEETDCVKLDKLVIPTLYQTKEYVDRKVGYVEDGVKYSNYVIQDLMSDSGVTKTDTYINGKFKMNQDAEGFEDLNAQLELGTNTVNDLTAEAGTLSGKLADAKAIKDYVDTKATELSIDATGDTYVSATVDTLNGKKVVVKTNASTDLLNDATTGKVADAKAVKDREDVLRNILGQELDQETFQKPEGVAHFSGATNFKSVMMQNGIAIQDVAVNNLGLRLVKEGESGSMGPYDINMPQFVVDENFIADKPLLSGCTSGKNIIEVLSGSIEISNEFLENAFSQTEEHFGYAKNAENSLYATKIGTLGNQSQIGDVDQPVYVAADGTITAGTKLGTASTHAEEDFATKDQGVKADTAIQNIKVTGTSDGQSETITISVNEAKEATINFGTMVIDCGTY